ncbi:hypothetical protein KY343_02375 [Candidatus Woesearchaeota archaeon]|nr:hypothetical protein [Candidatus Woesearchaeota archaeon]
MKRRVIRQKDSFTITLPMKWAREHGVGKELFVDEVEEGLLVKTESVPFKREAEIKLTSGDKRFLQYILNNYYRAGYDKLIIEGKVNEKDLYKALNLLPGFEVTDFTESRVIIESMSEVTEARFEVLIKQIFFIAKQDVIYIIDSLKNLEKIDVERMHVSSSRAIKNSNFCLRTVSRKKGDFNSFQWTMNNLITWIERQLYYLAVAIKDKKMEKLSKSELDYLYSVKDSLDNLYKGIYENKIETFQNIHKNFREYEEERFNLLKKQSRYKSTVLYYFSVMSRYIMTSTSSGIGIITMRD